MPGAHRFPTSEIYGWRASKQVDTGNESDFLHHEHLPCSLFARLRSGYRGLCAWEPHWRSASVFFGNLFTFTANASCLYFSNEFLQGATFWDCFQFFPFAFWELVGLPSFEIALSLPMRSVRATAAKWWFAGVLKGKYWKRTSMRSADVSLVDVFTRLGSLFGFLKTIVSVIIVDFVLSPLCSPRLFWSLRDICNHFSKKIFISWLHLRGGPIPGAFRRSCDFESYFMRSWDRASDGDGIG